MKIVEKRSREFGYILGRVSIEKPYMIWDDRNGDIFEEYFRTKAECEKVAKKNWNVYLTDHDKKLRNEYYTAQILAVDEEGIPMSHKVITRYK